MHWSTALGALAGAAVVVALGAGPAAGAASPPYYLAVGASESLGVQPSPAVPHGQPTDEGYANDLAAMEQSRWPGLRLVQVGCPGITALQAADGGGRCRYPEGSQLSAAVDFLDSHPGATVLTTVDLGFNDLRSCLGDMTVDEGCVTAALAEIQATLPRILGALRSAGGTAMRIVGLEHADPYLGDAGDGPAGRSFAETSLGVFDRLNDVLHDAYADAGDLTADVPAAFGVSGHDAADIDAEAARTCSLTWMCGPFGHNVHPDAEGYRLIAGAVSAALAGAGAS